MALAKAINTCLLENIQESIAIYKAVDEGNDFIITNFNPSAEKTENVSGEAVIGKKVTVAFPGVKDFGLLSTFQNVWKTGQAKFHPLRLYEDDRILGWRDNYVFKQPNGEIVAAYLDKTNEQKILKELEKTKALFSQILQQNPIGVVSVDIETGNIILINPIAQNVLGKDTKVGLNIREIEKLWEVIDTNQQIIKIEDHPMMCAIRGIVIENQSVMIRRLADGKVFWCDASAGPVYNDAGVLIAATLLFHNISADQTIQYKMKMISKFPESNPNPVMRITSEGKVVFSNQASIPLLESWGFSEGYLNSEKLLTLLKPLATSPRKTHFDVKVVDIIYSVSLVPIEDTTFLNVYALDITEREKATQELIQSQSKYYSLFNNMRDGYAYHKIITDSQGIPIDYEFLDINPAFATLTEMTREMCIGKRVTELLPTIREDPFDWIGKYGEVALNGINLNFESYSVSLQKYFEVFAYMPEPNHFVTIFRDITENVKAEEEIKRSRSRIKVLSGFLPICASCKKIRDDQGSWNELETYIDGHSEAKFTHGLCPECEKKYMADL